MTYPVLKVLDKTFVKVFYRNHSGLLLFSFITIFSYFFFIKTAGDVPMELQAIYQIKLVLLFVSDPLMLILVFFIWVIYTFKSWQFVAKQFLIEDQQFLFYSLSAIHKKRLFINWFIIQIRISLPIILFGVFAIVIGFSHQQYLIPIVIIVLIIIINSASAVYYCFLSHQLIHSKSFSYLTAFTKNWKKPFFSWFVYYTLDQLKISLLLTKIFSIIIISGLFYYFNSFPTDFRLIEFAVLMICLAHAFLIYHQHKFDITFFSLSKNLPYSKIYLFFLLQLSNSLLFLPEFLFLFYSYNLVNTTLLIFYLLSLITLFRGLLYVFGLNIKRYLVWSFGILIISFLSIMFKITYLGLAVNLILSFYFFNRNYYLRVNIQNN
jgi:hypothetical protein